MSRINVTLDINPEYLMNEDKKKIKFKKENKKETYFEIEEALFDIALRKGLIEKTDDGYIFIGDYEEFLSLKNKHGFSENSDWLD